jgi:hypothetical protein
MTCDTCQRMQEKLRRNEEEHLAAIAAVNATLAEKDAELRRAYAGWQVERDERTRIEHDLRGELQRQP